MIHSAIIAKLYIQRPKNFYLLYVTINPIYGDLSLWSTSEFDLRRRSADDSSRSLIIIHIHIHRICACVESPACDCQDIKIPRRVAVRSTNSVVVVCTSWYLISYNRTILLTRRATWQSVSHNTRTFDV